VPSPSPIRVPDLGACLHWLEVERIMPIAAPLLYEAWTRGIDRWFAAPGSVLMTPAVNAPFFFETEFQIEDGAPPERHPHYGRFLRLEQDRLIEMTWVTGPAGTRGVETVLTVELHAVGAGTSVHLRHAGFGDAETRDRTRLVWPYVLGQMEARLLELGEDS